jgi:cold shock CspA family protein
VAFQHEGGQKQMHIGTIKAVRLERGFGFISRPQAPDIFFHCRDLVGLPFDEQLQERRVRFVEIQTDRGARAREIQPAD